MNITEKVKNFPTKHQEGLTSVEIETLLKEYPDIDIKKFNETLVCL